MKQILDKLLPQVYEVKGLRTGNIEIAGIAIESFETGVSIAGKLFVETQELTYTVEIGGVDFALENARLVVTKWHIAWHKNRFRRMADVWMYCDKLIPIDKDCHIGYNGYIRNNSFTL